MNREESKIQQKNRTEVSKQGSERRGERREGKSDDRKQLT